MSYEETLEDTGARRLRLLVHEDCPNPRLDYDHFAGALTLPSRSYADVAEPGELAETAKARLVGRYSPDDVARIFRRWVGMHGGVSMEDWIHRDGPRVVWYVTPEMAEPAGTPTELLGELVRGEAEEYRAWAEGDCWGYVIEELVTYVRLDDLDKPRDDRRLTGAWEQVDSCWGFIGREYAEQSAREAFGDVAATVRS